MIRLSRIVGSTLIYATATTSSRFAGGHLGAAAFLIENGSSGSTVQQSFARAAYHTPNPLNMVSTTIPPNTNTLTNGEDDGSDRDWERIDVLPYADSSHNSATIAIPTAEEEEDGGDDESRSMFVREGFAEFLTNTVQVLKELEKSSVWIEVPMSRAGFIEDIEAAGLGFEFHHAHGKAAKLNAWLREDIPSKVPEFATHHVGVGAVVINSRDEILCIRELRKNYHPWKIPTGLAELGESIHEAAEREVLEETGITASCHSVLSFRHTHGMANGRSDLFFVCRLIPEEDSDGNTKTPVPQACEIAEAKWLPLSEYRDMVDGLTEESKGHPVMTFVMNQILDKGLRINMREVNSVVPGRKPTPLYYPEPPE